MVGAPLKAARSSRSAALLCLALACSSGETGPTATAPSLEGDLCVDETDPCCCKSELSVSSPGGPPPCSYGFGGQAEGYTFELVTPSGSSVLVRVADVAACGTEGGWYSTVDGGQLAELCPATCSRLRNEDGRLRALRDCPAQAC